MVYGLHGGKAECPLNLYLEAKDIGFKCFKYRDGNESSAPLHTLTTNPHCTPYHSPPQVRMAEDIDFKYPMKKACAWEISTFCKDVPHGHARVVRCLEENIENTDMSKECKDEVSV